MLKLFWKNSDDTLFSEERYKSLIPFLSNINSYLQTFLSVFASSMMALNAALITVILSRKGASFWSLGFGGWLFIASIIAYLFAFAFLLVTRAFLFRYAQDENASFKAIVFFVERNTAKFIAIMLATSIAFFVSFILLLKVSIT